MFLKSSTFEKKNGESMRLQFTAVFEKVPLGYIAYVEELPGANTQGDRKSVV
jgi:hypothetical protein